MNKLDLTDNRNRILPKMLATQAAQAGDTEFLITDERRVTFAQAEDLTNRLASGLKNLGVSKGDRVAFYLESDIEIVLVALATNKLGAIWVPVNTDYKGAWLSDTISRSRCKVFITEVSLQERIAEVRDALGDAKVVVHGAPNAITLNGAVSLASLLDNPPFKADYDAMHYGETCAILWTSGTTGKSKGVLQSHNCWVRPIAEAASLYFETQEGDVIYNVLPLYNSGAWITAIFRALYEGIPVVLEKRFSVTTFWDRIRHFGATQTFTLGAMHMFLWNSPEKPDDAENPLRVAQMVPMPEQLREPFAKRFGVKLLPMGYGQSECMLIGSAYSPDKPMPFSCLGRTLDDMEVRLLDDAGNDVPDGEPGEICLRPLKPYILFNGYFDDEAATKAAYTGEWYHTGDMAKRDPHGNLWFADRKRDAVRFGGRNISTMEVEMVVRKHPAVRDVAAFGLPSAEVPGESELKINIVLKPDMTVTYEEMARFINENAPYYFVPRYMEFVEQLPYTPTNKVQKYKLREQGLTANTWKLKESSYEVQR